MLNCEKIEAARNMVRQTCQNLAREHAHKILNFGKPVVLSNKRYNMIRQHAGQKTDEQLEMEERERLRQSAAAAAIRQVKVKPTPEEVLAEARRNLELKAEHARASLAANQQVAEALRRQKVAKAELLIQKLKNGPRELRSAALQSEMLRARNVQVQINEIIKDSVKKQDQADKVACQEQIATFIGKDQQRKQERQERENKYRNEMFAYIQENRRIRCESKRALIEQERRERAQIDLEIEMQRNRERQAIEKKREMCRKNAVEAMKMVEERKKRDAMYDEVEDRLNCVYHTGRRQLEQLKAQQEKHFAEERKKLIEANTAMLSKIQQSIQNNEEERLRRDIDTLKLKFDEAEQKKRDRERELKRQRIAAHLQEMEQIRQNRERECELKRFEVAQRFKNAEVNARFDEADRVQQQTRAKCVRAQLMADEKERQRLQREKAEKARLCDSKRDEEEDNFFFKYAHTLMEDARKKERPLHPYRRVINDYRRSNMRDMQKPKLPRHLVSNVNVLQPQPPQQQQRPQQQKPQQPQQQEECKNPALDQKAGGDAMPISTNATGTEKCAAKTERSPKMSMVKAETLEYMAKVEAMLAEEERQRSSKRPKPCESNTCLTETKGQTNANEKNNGLQLTEADSAKLRYGIQELKLLGTPAPSVH